ncbi:MAG: type II toxin-antitoxin system VapC family toxin [Thermoguttaceae bacterium]
MILLDTSVLGRMSDPADPRCAVARGAVNLLLAKNERVIVVPQNIYEFWAVATRRPGAPPGGQNGLGMAPDMASQWLGFFQRRFTLLPDREDLLARWHQLVRTLRITGVRSYDAHLAAAMQSYGITRLLTFNVDHFKNLPVTPMEPANAQ